MTGQRMVADFLEIDWTSEDEELEQWCLHNGFEPIRLAYRVDAASQERWDKYVDDLKRYALECKTQEEFCAWINHVDPPYDFKKNWAVMPNGKICVAG